MKKFLEAWKLWTVLSTLLFFMTCGVFIAYAASNSGGMFFTKYNTEGMDNKLTASSWDNLMEDLDNLIPEGAIVAFATDRCPDGWTVFTGADEKFLMWTTLSSNVGITWWTNYLTEVPTHNHMIYNYLTQVNGSSEIYVWTKNLNNKYVTVWYHKLKDSPGSENRSKRITRRAQTQPEDQEEVPYIYHATELTWKSSINITNPYIKVLYCIKWNGTTSSPSEYCPNDYTLGFDWPCNDGYEINYKQSNMWNACWKCVEQSCWGQRVSCSYTYQWPNWGDLWNETIRLGKSWESSCVMPGCCITNDEASTLFSNETWLRHYIRDNIWDEPSNTSYSFDSLKNFLHEYCSNPV